MLRRAAAGRVLPSRALSVASSTVAPAAGKSTAVREERTAAAAAHTLVPPPAKPVAAEPASVSGWHPAPTRGTLGAQFAKAREEDEHKDAVLIGTNNLRWTFKELDRQVDALGNGLISARLQPGHTLISTLDNDAESLMAVLAAAECGIQLVSLPGATAGELVAALSATQAEGVILDPKVIKPESLFAEIPELDHYPAGKAFACARFPALRNILQTDYRPRPGMLTFRDTLGYELHPQHNYLRRWAVPMVTPESPMLGSASGKSVATHSESLKNAQTVAAKLKLGPHDRVCLAGSVVSGWAVQNAVLPTLTSRAMLVIPSKKNDNVTEVEVRDIVAALSTEHASVLVTSSEMLDALLEKPEAVTKFDLSLRAVAVVGGNEKNASEVKRVFGVEEFVTL